MTCSTLVTCAAYSHAGIPGTGKSTQFVAFWLVPPFARVLFSSRNHCAVDAVVCSAHLAPESDADPVVVADIGKWIEPPEKLRRNQA